MGWGCGTTRGGERARLVGRSMPYGLAGAYFPRYSRRKSNTKKLGFRFPPPRPKMGFGWCMAGSRGPLKAILSRRSLMVGLDSLDSRRSLACFFHSASAALVSF